MKDLSPKILVSDAEGIYIPQAFAQSYNIEDNFINYSDIAECLLYLSQENSPDKGAYWDVWDELISHARLVDEDGNESFLYQNGDLWEVFLNNNNSEFFDEFN